MRTNRQRRRSPFRFRPHVDSAGDGAVALDRRLLLSVAAAKGAMVLHRDIQAIPRVHPSAHVSRTPAASGRVTPAQEVRKVYSQFLANFQAAETSYVQSLTQQATSTVTVVTTLTTPYLAGSATMNVLDPGVFGSPTQTSPVTAYAVAGGAQVGVFQIIGISATQVAINTTSSSLVNLAQGTQLTAQVPQTAATSSASIFPGYITSSTQLMAVQLVNYFNSLPFKLPRMFALPHQSQRAGALQQQVYQLVAGSGPVSLRSQLNAISLPQTPGADLQIYDAAVRTVITSSELQMLGDIQQIFANKLPVIPSNNNNNSGLTTTGGTGSTASTGTTGTGTATTGTA